MKKKLRKYIILPLLAVLWLCGCGKKEETDKAETAPDTAAETESQTEETEEKEQERTQYPVSEADTETIYADREKNQELADFLIAYYQIPEEFCTETRYYYDRVDLNEDGTEEILAVVVGEYTECAGISGAGKFCVYPHTGVCERCDVGRMARSYFSGARRGRRNRIPGVSLSGQCRLSECEYGIHG